MGAAVMSQPAIPITESIDLIDGHEHSENGCVLGDTKLIEPSESDSKASSSWELGDLDHLNRLCQKCIELRDWIQAGWKLQRGPDGPDFEHLYCATLLDHTYLGLCHLCSLIWHACRRSMVRPKRNSKERRPDMRATLSFPSYDVMEIRDAEPTLRRMAVSTRNHSAPIPICSGSIEALSMAKRWFEGCRTNHSRCDPPLSKARRLPTRLVDLGCGPDLVRLITTSTANIKENYATLSYCWGKKSVFTLTSKTQSQLFSGVSIKLLPRTIQDAISVARHLCFRYLWIDSLCILQDSAADWNYESSRMCDVYQMSALTIAALHAGGSDEGLFVKRNPVCLRPCWLFDDQEGNPVYAESIVGTLRPTSDLPLKHRAWVLQEESLSRRVLYFGEKLEWLCNGCFASELGHAAPHAEAIDIASPRKLIDNAFQAHLETQEKAPKNPSENTLWNNSLGRSLEEMWELTVQNYMRRQLTFESDRLKAISGLLVAVKQSWGIEHKCCLLLPFLIKQLAWRSELRVGSAPQNVDAPAGPSWSWISLGGGVLVSFIAQQATTVERYLAEIANVQEEIQAPPNEPDFNTPLASSDILQIRGMLTIIEASLLNKPTTPGGGDARWCWDSEVQQAPRVKRPPPPECYLLPLIETRRYRIDTTWALVLQVEEKRPHPGNLSHRDLWFRRIGVVMFWGPAGSHSHGIEWGEMVTVTLV